jgi:uncharacterized phage protein (TIGR02218 family)
MRTISTNLKAEIDAGTIARFIKISCTNGTVHAFTDHDQALTIDGVLYSPAPALAAVEYVATSDVQVSSQQTGAAIVDVPEADLLGGVFDDAEVEASWGSWVHPEYGHVVTFFGRIASIDWDETAFKAEIMSFMKQLELNVGQTYTASCRHELFGSVTAGKVGACTLSSASYTFVGTVATVVTPKWKLTYSGAAAAQPDGYFSNGSITFTSGILNGLTYPIKKDASDTFDFVLPTMKTFAVGDTFTVKAGCDKTLDTCKTKFSNVLNFGGFPHINTDVNFR